jgi:hypothetical protein
MSDAQLTNVTSVRPIKNFEAVYQGQDGTIPIAFPGVLDPLAGSEGYAADLLAGISTPLGSRVLIEIPMVIDQYLSVPTYAYQLIWRLRNQNSFVQTVTQGRQGAGYHIPSEQLGRNEIQTHPTSQLFFIPGASDVEIFVGADPGGTSPGTLSVRQQRYIPKLGDSWVQPLTEAGDNGIWQQGAYQFTSNVNCSGPTWFPISTVAQGDELMILVYKTNSAQDWDFTGPDKGFSNTYGNNDGGLPLNPHIGILVATGSLGG